MLWRCWLGGRQGIRPVKTEWWGAGVVVCLERGADLHTAQLMPLPLTVSCFSKTQIGSTFLVQTHLGSPGQLFHHSPLGPLKKKKIRGPWARAQCANWSRPPWARLFFSSPHIRGVVNYCRRRGGGLSFPGGVEWTVRTMISSQRGPSTAHLRRGPATAA